MNELSKEDKNKIYTDIIMVSESWKAKVKEWFDFTQSDINKLRQGSGLTEDEYYIETLIPLYKQEKAEENKNRNNEKARIRKLMQRFLDEKIDNFTINLDRLGRKQLQSLFETLSGGDEGKFLIKAMDGDEIKHIWTYNDRMVKIWRKLIKGKQFEEIEEGTGSDRKVVEVIRNFDKLVIERVKEKVKFEGNVLNIGAYFKYYHKLTDIDLSRYGIYRNKEEAVANGNYKDNCFLECLSFAGASEETLQIVRTKMKNRYIKQSDLNPICKQAKIYVECRMRSKTRLEKKWYGYKEMQDVEGRSFKIALVDEHYIIDEDLETPISNYTLKNWEKMKDNLPYNYDRQARNRKCRKDKGELCTNSFKLVEKMLQDRKNFLERIPRVDLLDTQYYDHNTQIETLTIGDENYEPMEKRLERIVKKHKKSKKLKTINIFLDFETNTKARQAKHTIDENGTITDYNVLNKNKKAVIRHKSYLGCCMAVYWEDGEWVEEEIKTFYDRGKEGLKVYQPFGQKPKIVENTAGRQMVRYIANTFYEFDNINLIAHNAGYDLRVGLFPYLYNYEGIENGSQFILASANIYPTCDNAKKYLKDKKRPAHIPVKIKCSYKMTDIKLAKFGETFKLPQQKEVMPYNLYTTKNIQLRYIPFKECLEEVKEEDKQQFLENINKWKLYDSETDKIDIIGYSREYCKIDVKVLKDGYMKFRDQIIEISQEIVKTNSKLKKKCPDLVIDIFNHYTISSVANEMLMLGGCYDDTYQFAGVVREFIQKCVVGGRVMTRRNEKVMVEEGEHYQECTKKNVKQYIVDFDAVGLYNSVLYRIPGFIKGIPKILDDMSEWTDRNKIIEELNRLTNDSHYFLEININRVGIKRDFPLMSYTDGLTRFWTNEVIGSEDEPIPMYCDRTMLEDWIEFHDIDFTIIRGYYFDEGYNPKINETMKYLFEERQKQKKLGSPIQSTLKLIANSGYGKTLEKAHEDTILYKTEAEYNKYIAKKYNFIKEITPTIDGRYKCKEWATIDRHFNQVHQGVSVLSMSKRIMSEVMCLAEDNKMGVFYTDTDSIHMYSEDAVELAKLWDKKYGGKPERTYHRQTNYIRTKSLVGKYMGQFHNDFDLDGVAKKYEHLTRSLKFIGLGKKCYIDMLEGFDKDKKSVYGFHIRMKGVSNDAIKYKASRIAEINNIPLREALETLYKRLFDGEDITFDLCKYGDGREKLCFKFFNDFTIGNMNDEETSSGKIGFTRTIQFK
jgi:hypothetical protein